MIFVKSGMKGSAVARSKLLGGLSVPQGKKLVSLRGASRLA